ncbi:MAG: HEAT repeat domain-containing protein, partial [Melioribacteraceae bacterium]|nr:HEAT repeat domain-containing protein [Melioribacteraceae bacterium]
MIKIKELITILLVLLFSLTSLAAESNNNEKYRQIEDNLLVGINTENRGLQISCAYFLGEMQSERAIIPLLKMLKSGETEEERIIAALSL